MCGTMEVGDCIINNHSHLNVFIATTRMAIVQITNIINEFKGNDAWLDIVA